MVCPAILVKALVLYIKLDKSSCPRKMTHHWRHGGKIEVENLYNSIVYHIYAITDTVIRHC